MMEATLVDLLTQATLVDLLSIDDPGRVQF